MRQTKTLGLGGWVGGGLLAALALACLGAPVICRALGLEPEAVDLLAASLTPSWDHPMGTDDLGRDLLARLLWGGRVSLFVGLIGALAAAGIGTALGMVAGYRGGRLDALLMRLTDGIIALPMLPLLIVLAAVDPTKLGVPEAFARSPEMDVLRIVIIVALLGWTTTARLVRATTLSLKERDFVRAAQALGADEGTILRRDFGGGAGDLVGIGPVLSGAGYSAADAQLGQYADWGIRNHLDRPLAGRLARWADLYHSDCSDAVGRCPD
jgi:ABC-type dipeptide/oligopeptide/nickel transport system permease subunit